MNKNQIQKELKKKLFDVDAEEIIMEKKTDSCSIQVICKRGWNATIGLTIAEGEYLKSMVKTNGKHVIFPFEI